MALADHLRELRARVLRAVLVLALGVRRRAVLLRRAARPRAAAVQPRRRSMLGDTVDTKAYIKGAAGPLLVQLKLSGIAALVATSPYWLYQIWAFIVPGLHAREKRWTKVFVAIAGPLFILGRRRRLLRASQGARGPHRLHPGEPREPRGVRGVLLLLHPDAAGVRGVLRDPALRHPAQPGRRGVGQVAGGAPGLDHPRRLRLRRRGDPVDGPVLDAHARAADDAAVLRLGARRPAGRPASRPSSPSTTSTTTRPPTSTTSPRTSRPPTSTSPTCRRPGRADRSDVSRHTVAAVDAFDLPGWVGEAQVRWVAESGLAGGAQVTGRLEADADPGLTCACDLLACDRAYPEPVLDEGSRAEAHQAWTLGRGPAPGVRRSADPRGPGQRDDLRADPGGGAPARQGRRRTRRRFSVVLRL